MDTSIQLAGIIGPVLIALSISEYINFKIWRDVPAPVVYLNGLVLLTGGLIVIRIHNFWFANWTVLITILGWLFLLLGLSRMFFPNKKQLEKKIATDLLLLVLLILGVFLLIKSYFL